MSRDRRANLLWVALLLTVAAPVILNAVNLYRLSVERLGLVGPAAFALPVTLDGAALVALIVRLRGLRDGDSTPAASLAVLGFAGLSSWLAAVEGYSVGGPVGAVALGALPIVAIVMLDLAVGSVRRADLREQGLLPGRAPVFSVWRWVLAPRSTAAAWRHGVLWENSDRIICLAETAPGSLPETWAQWYRSETGIGLTPAAGIETGPGRRGLSDTAPVLPGGLTGTGAPGPAPASLDWRGSETTRESGGDTAPVPVSNDDPPADGAPVPVAPVPVFSDGPGRADWTGDELVAKVLADLAAEHGDLTPNLVPSGRAIIAGYRVGKTRAARIRAEVEARVTEMVRQGPARQPETYSGGLQEGIRGVTEHGQAKGDGSERIERSTDKVKESHPCITTEQGESGASDISLTVPFEIISGVARRPSVEQMHAYGPNGSPPDSHAVPDGRIA